eukprot:7574650-Pyramimonas_sp.AAC.1
MWPPPLGPSVELPMGPQSVVQGGSNAWRDEGEGEEGGGGEEREERRDAGIVSSKRGPTTTGWLGNR